MGDTTIEWTLGPDGRPGKSWNPVTGCTRTSPGCGDATGGGCYAEAIAHRFAGSVAWPNGFDVTLRPDRLDDPLHWSRGRRVFVNSSSDLFHEDIPAEFVQQVWDTMAKGRQHTYLILTKRSKRMRDLVNAMHDCDHGGVVTSTCPWCGPLPNVHLGVSIENDRYTFRQRHLAETTAAVRFLSLEPLLGPLPSLHLDGVGMVIVGGESGPRARPMNLSWVRDLRDQAAAAGVPYFVKQLGTAWSRENGYGAGKANSWDKCPAWPEDLRIREVAQ